MSSSITDSSIPELVFLVVSIISAGWLGARLAGRYLPDKRVTWVSGLVFFWVGALMVFGVGKWLGGVVVGVSPNPAALAFMVVLLGGLVDATFVVVLVSRAERRQAVARRHPSCGACGLPSDRSVALGFCGNCGARPLEVA